MATNTLHTGPGRRPAGTGNAELRICGRCGGRGVLGGDLCGRCGGVGAVPAR